MHAPVPEVLREGDAECAERSPDFVVPSLVTCPDQRVLLRDRDEDEPAGGRIDGSIPPTGCRIDADPDEETVHMWILVVYKMR
jgi:hypothetical protein